MKCLKYVIVAFAIILAGCGESSDSIKIGISSALTGPVQVPGNWALKGALLAAEEINANGGNVELIVEDDMCSAEEASNTVNKLVDLEGLSRVFIFCSAAAPGTTEITRDEAVVIYPSVKSIDQGNYYTLYPDVSLEMQHLGHYIVHDRKIKRIAQFYQSDAAGEAIKDEFIEAFTDLGGEVVFVEAFNNFQGVDYKTSLLKAQEADVEAIMLTAAPANFITAVKQAAEIDLDIQFFSNSLGAENAIVVNELGDLSEGIEYSSPYYNLANTDFKKGYEERYGEIPSVWAAFGYDAIKIFAQLECEEVVCLQEELQGIENYSGASGEFSITSERTTDRPIYIKRIVAGEFEVIKVY